MNSDQVFLLVMVWALCIPLSGYLMLWQDWLLGAITGGMKLTPDDQLRRIGWVMGAFLGPLYVVSIALTIIIVAPILFVCIRLGFFIRTGEWSE